MLGLGEIVDAFQRAPLAGCILTKVDEAATVGGALSALPEKLDVPWWRVISSSGKISTSSIHHTAQIQRALLEDEGVRFTEGGRIDWDRYEWDPDDEDLERVLGTVCLPAGDGESAHFAAGDA